MKIPHKNSLTHSPSSIKLISGIKFTPREIDILACLLTRRTAKDIASNLSLSRRTVENYIHNIMERTERNSRERIIDFLEKSDQLPSLRKLSDTLIPPTIPSSEPPQTPSSPFPSTNRKNKKDRFLNQKKGLLILLGMIFFLIVCGGLWIVLKPANTGEKIQSFYIEDSIRSDLNIPTDKSLLDRPELISQLKEKLKNQNGIQTVALVGPGGAGKTTLARQYAHQEKANVIWEINAESLETLAISFENLAQALAKTKEDQKTVKDFQEIKNLTERVEVILQFVKERLKSSSNWFLLYDNVEKFSDVQKYFPQDFKTWGQGKIIVTTRDSTIENNKHINGEIQIGEFTPDQKLKLFCKIRTRSFTPLQLEETKVFLAKLPSFPLDVSVAAYYLNAVNVSYEDYLENIARVNEDFAKVQEDLLKEAGDYTKTRYGIITLSLQKLLDTHKDFADLLLFISLLDSQNIPTELLFTYKNSDIVNNFIYHLKKYSLVTDPPSSTLESTISLHRSTQAIILAHLIKKLNLETNPQILQSFVDTLEFYIDDAISKDALEKLKGLVPHVETLSKHTNLLTESQRGSLETELGYVYISLGNYKNATHFLEKSLGRLKNNSVANHNKIAQNLVGQGNILAMDCKYAEAKELLEEGLVIYRKHAPDNQVGIAFALLSLGNLNRWSGHYKDAARLLEEALLIYNNNKSPNYMGKTMGLAYLGHVYNKLGDYKKAIDFLEKDREFCKKHLSPTSIRLGWILVFLGMAYENIGHYKKAKDLIEESVLIYKMHLPENDTLVCANLIYLGGVYVSFGDYKKAHSILEKCLDYQKQHPEFRHIFFTSTTVFLGRIYCKQKNYQKARTLLEQALATYEKYYGKEHIETAQLLNEVGKVYLLEGQLDKAESIFQKSLEILERSNHPQRYATLENLSDLFLKQAELFKNEKNLQAHAQMREKAQDALKQALQVVEVDFPSDSPHIKRLQEKLKTL
jgi:tetratricopeptide (TPR) repeat protein/DNA-binding CsgD family transcriptional regulator